MSRSIDLWLVRHAESIGNIDGTDANTDLSPRGYAQARLLAPSLKGFAFDAVWTSPLHRAQRTAALALPNALPRVDERIVEFRPGPPVQFIDTSSLDLATLPGPPISSADNPIETGKEFMARVQAWLTELPNGRMIAFTHFGVMREILATVVGFRHVPQTMSHASVYRLDLSAEAPRFVNWWQPPSDLLAQYSICTNKTTKHDCH